MKVMYSLLIGSTLYHAVRPDVLRQLHTLTAHVAIRRTSVRAVHVIDGFF